jgi:ankyrin repeat protein
MSAAAVSAAAAASAAPSASAPSTSTSSAAAAASSSLDTQLIAATRDGKGLEECKSLIEKGARVNAKNSSRNTALHYAARYGQDAIAKLLLEHGAVPNVKNGRHWYVTQQEDRYVDFSLFI